MDERKWEDAKMDEGLQGNDKIESAIAGLQKETSEEMLAHTLTVIRRRIQEQAQVIVAVEPPVGEQAFRVQTVKTGDGKIWWMAFTSFEEEMKGSGSVMSTFLTDLGTLLRSAQQVEAVNGVILNPWNRTIMLDKNLIGITLGKANM